MMNTEAEFKTSCSPYLQAEDHAASVADYNYQYAELMASKADDVLTKINVVHTIALSLMNRVQTMMITETEAKFNQLKTSSCSTLLLQADDNDDDASVAKKYNHHSAELIGSNDDLLTEILSRLPAAKSFFRFKSVSKQWLSLLTHPRFSTLMFDQRLNSSGLYYNKLHVSFDVQNPTTPPFCSLDFSPDDDLHGIRIVQSCNGLLLCCCDKYRGCSGNYCVCNPTTNKVAAIPPVIGSRWDQSRLIRLMGLAYHPTECVHYKLVCILRHTDARGYEVSNEHGHRMYNIQIYSSQTGEWKKLNQTFAPSGSIRFRYGVYWNGAFHWAPSCDNPMYLRLDTEDVQELPLPSPLPERVASEDRRGHYSCYNLAPLYFGESRGHLHLVDTVDKKNPLSLKVYEMPRDLSGWFIKYQLDLHQLSAAYPNMTYKFSELCPDKYDFRVLDVVRGEEEEDTFMVVKAIDDIKRYNIRAKSFKQLLRIPDKIEDVHDSLTVTFIQTFHPYVGHRYIEKLGSF